MSQKSVSLLASLGMATRQCSSAIELLSLQLRVDVTKWYNTTTCTWPRYWLEQ